jgi:hypothetical protein
MVHSLRWERRRNNDLLWVAVFVAGVALGSGTGGGPSDAGVVEKERDERVGTEEQVAAGVQGATPEKPVPVRPMMMSLNSDMEFDLDPDALAGVSDPFTSLVLPCWGRSVLCLG